MATPSIQTLITQAQQVLNLKSSNEIRATLAAVLANANVGTPLNPNLTTQQLWDEFYEIVRQPSDDILSIITDQMMRMVFSPPAPGGAGADKQVIFNDGGVLAGDAGLVYNKTTDTLTAGNATITGAATVGTTFAVGTVTPDIFARFYTRSIGFDSSGSTVLQINGTSYGGLDLGAAGVRTFGITSSATNANISTVTNIPLIFNINNATKMTLNTAGNLAFPTGKGIDFSAVTGGTGTATANVLNDYEEGTWTGTLTGTTTPATPITATGKYTKIGRQVYVQINFENISNAGYVGYISITGLPFSSAAAPSATQGVARMDSIGTFTGSTFSYISNNASIIDVYQNISNSAATPVDHNAGSSRFFYVSHVYTV
jgi:hypothetical protein